MSERRQANIWTNDGLVTHICAIRPQWINLKLGLRVQQCDLCSKRNLTYQVTLPEQSVCLIKLMWNLAMASPLKCQEVFNFAHFYLPVDIWGERNFFEADNKLNFYHFVLMIMKTENCSRSYVLFVCIFHSSDVVTTHSHSQIWFIQTKWKGKIINSRTVCITDKNSAIIELYWKHLDSLQYHIRNVYMHFAWISVSGCANGFIARTYGVVQAHLSNTNRECFIAKCHNNICSNFYHVCCILQRLICAVLWGKFDSVVD